MSAHPLDRNQNAQLGACTYLMHMLLEEMERRQGGFVRTTIEQVVNDHAGIPEDVPDKAFVDSVFAEVLNMLRRADPANALPELPPAPRPRAG